MSAEIFQTYHIEFDIDLDSGLSELSSVLVLRTVVRNRT